MEGKESANIAQVFQDIANMVDDWRLVKTYSDVEIAYGLIEVLAEMGGGDNWKQYLSEALAEVLDKDGIK